MQRAVKELTKNHLDVKLNNDYYISGYSQGGWATMQLQKAMEQNYSNEFNLKASACGAGPYDLNYINKYVLELDNYPMPYFLAYILNSYYNLGGITTPVNEIFNAPFDSKISTLFDGTKSGAEINNELSTKISLLFTNNYIKNFETDTKFSSVREMLTKNSISAWKTKIPTMLLHGTNDTFIPSMGSNRMHQGFISKGVDVNTIKLVPLLGKTHSTGIVPSGIASIAWFLDLRDGE
jgi:pimeloyl-ACP methyl ester carboxylesterase